MAIVTSDTEIGNWIEAQGKFLFCFDHKATENQSEFSDETFTTHTAQYVEMPTKDESQVKKVFFDKVIDLTKRKTQNIYNLLAGREVDQTQIDRYKQKALWAKNDKDELLQAEADLIGISVKRLKALILQTAEAWQAGFDNYSSQIETFRIATNNLIEKGDFAKAQKVLELGEQLGKGVTAEDIKALF